MNQMTRRMILAASTGAAATSLANRRGFEFEVLSESPAQFQTPLHYLKSLITPTEVFFVRSHFGPPRFNLTRKLSITGRVNKRLTLGLYELSRLPQTSVTAVLQCAGNGRSLFSPKIPGVQWTHGAMGQAEWTGVKLSHLLELADCSSGANHLHLTGADRPPKPQTPPFIRSIPVDEALNAGAIVAIKMNGALLSLAHGAPFRFVMPGWAGDHWLKWLTNIDLADSEHEGFFVKKAYRIPPKPVQLGSKVPPEQMVPVTVMPVRSIIASPDDGGVVPKGRTEIVGVAFSGVAPIASVEVSTDDGATWDFAKLEGSPGVGRWQLFRHTVESESSHVAVVRAIDRLGNAQPREAIWNPSGYYWNGWHRIHWSAK